MDMLFQPDTYSTPLPNQLHTPLHSSLLAVGVADFGVGLGALGDCGVEGASIGVGASGDVVGVLG